MTRLKSFSATNPTGETPGMEAIRHDVLKAAIDNVPAAPPEMSLSVSPPPPPIPLINKNMRLPADLVEFIDYEYTKRHRMKKQDAYTLALEQFFRPLMPDDGKGT